MTLNQGIVKKNPMELTDVLMRYLEWGWEIKSARHVPEGIYAETQSRLIRKA